MGWRPISYRFIVRPDPIEQKTEAGVIVVVDEKLERNAAVTGTIVWIGEDAFVAYKTVTPYAGLRIGDRIAFAKYSGVFLKNLADAKGEEVMGLNDADIIAKWVDGDTDDVASA